MTAHHRAAERIGDTGKMLTYNRRETWPGGFRPENSDVSQ